MTLDSQPILISVENDRKGKIDKGQVFLEFEFIATK